MMIEAKFARDESVADAIVHLLGDASRFIEGALYRFNHPGLAQALEEAVERGVQVRLLVDANKYKENRTTQELLAGAIIPFRLAYGRRGRGSKMHHKFMVVDRTTVLTGSYNWTLESEDENHENLIVMREAALVEAYLREFDALWTDAAPDNSWG
jgi:phosphatidylserine/phosphatidylglycerophosphate/cardiolipin synthase-like enzyme